MENYSYETAGLDGFLSRSIDSQAAVSTQFRYDFSQLSGATGNAFRLGKIRLDGSQNTIVLNDGTIMVNDSRTGTGINIGGGRILYEDADSVPRLLLDGKFGLKISNVGKDVTVVGTQPGFADDLAFDSDNPGIAISTYGTLTLTSISVTAPAGEWKANSTNFAINHGLDFIPGVIAFAVDSSNFYHQLPYTIPAQYGASPSSAASFVTYQAHTTSSQLTIDVNLLAHNGAAVSSDPLTVKYYLLKQRAN